jgi:hypothetical protein
VFFLTFYPKKSGEERLRIVFDDVVYGAKHTSLLALVEKVTTE